jgi:hypothetical protein
MMDKERLNRLIAAKFEKTGTWRRNEQQQAICDGSVPTSPGVYLFIVGGVVQYVGSAQRSLFARMTLSTPTSRKNQKVLDTYRNCGLVAASGQTRQQGWPQYIVAVGSIGSGLEPAAITFAGQRIPPIRRRQ